MERSERFRFSVPTVPLGEGVPLCFCAVSRGKLWTLGGVLAYSSTILTETITGYKNTIFRIEDFLGGIWLPFHYESESEKHIPRFSFVIVSLRIVHAGL